MGRRLPRHHGAMDLPHVGQANPQSRNMYPKSPLTRRGLTRHPPRKLYQRSPLTRRGLNRHHCELDPPAGGRPTRRRGTGERRAPSHAGDSICDHRAFPREAGSTESEFDWIPHAGRPILLRRRGRGTSARRG